VSHISLSTDTPLYVAPAFADAAATRFRRRRLGTSSGAAYASAVGANSAPPSPGSSALLQPGGNPWCIGSDARALPALADTAAVHPVVGTPTTSCATASLVTHTTSCASSSVSPLLAVLSASPAGSLQASPVPSESTTPARPSPPRSSPPALPVVATLAARLPGWPLADARRFWYLLHNQDGLVRAYPLFARSHGTVATTGAGGTAPAGTEAAGSGASANGGGDQWTQGWSESPSLLARMMLGLRTFWRERGACKGP